MARENFYEGTSMVLDTTKKAAELLVMVTGIVATGVVILAFKADEGRGKTSLVQPWTCSPR